MCSKLRRMETGLYIPYTMPFLRRTNLFEKLSGTSSCSRGVVFDEVTLRVMYILAMIMVTSLVLFSSLCVFVASLLLPQ
jgi:hypothetical protein